jgi:hypothetical protein
MKKIPFNWNDASHTDTINKYKLKGTNPEAYLPIPEPGFPQVNNPFSGYKEYFPAGFRLWGKNITKSFPDGTYKLEIDPAGAVPTYWVSGTIENKDNPYSAFVHDMNNSPKISGVNY